MQVATLHTKHPSSLYEVVEMSTSGALKAVGTIVV
jgi:hypothetical protein